MRSSGSMSRRPVRRRFSGGGSVLAKADLSRRSVLAKADALEEQVLRSTDRPLPDTGETKLLQHARRCHMRGVDAGAKHAHVESIVAIGDDRPRDFNGVALPPERLGHAVQ